jgi:hypothetical protein
MAFKLCLLIIYFIWSIAKNMFNKKMSTAESV